MFFIEFFNFQCITNSLIMSHNELIDPKDQNFGNPEDTKETATTSETQGYRNDAENLEVAQTPATMEQGNASDTPADDTLNEKGVDETITVAPVTSNHEPNEKEVEEATTTHADADDQVNEEDNDEAEEDIDDIDAEKHTISDYSSLSKDELVQTLKNLINNNDVDRIKNDVDSIKSIFYRKHKIEIEHAIKAFVDAGGDAEQFEPAEDNAEIQIKELLKQYKEQRSQFTQNQESQKQGNLERKLQIIEQIKELVNRNESVTQTFQDFRTLQQQFREIGPVPQTNLDDLWETYHHHVQNFYDYVKINKELRDLDLKRNLEEKIRLCEKAEELLLEPSIVNAFKKLQKYHEEWREIGPVPHENQNEIWERFKEATRNINKNHQDYFEKLRNEQRHNLEAKIALCEKAEEIVALNSASNKDWNKLSKDMIELQKVWKTIGFAPKKDNNKVYDRFRTACDTFFNSKRTFYEGEKEEQMNNLQLKTELCIQAESLKSSTEWRKTTEDLIELQKRWKEIGPIPRKHSEPLWQRFRTACDAFFNNKSAHFSTVDNSYESNLKAKEALIAEIENYQPSDDVENILNSLKEFQRRWAEIGFVPMKQKEDVQKRYRTAINKHFEGLNIEEGKRNLIRFKSKVEGAQGNPRQENKMRVERDKLFNKLRQVESDIALWENNIGFFAKTKNAEAMIQEVERKIAKAKEEITILEEKIKLIDNYDKE